MSVCPVFVVVTSDTLAGLALSVFQQIAVDLTQSDGQWLLVDIWGYQWANELEDTIIDGLEVIVDLTGPLGCEDNQSVLGGHLSQELIDRRVGDANRSIEHLLVRVHVLVVHSMHLLCWEKFVGEESVREDLVALQNASDFSNSLLKVVIDDNLIELILRCHLYLGGVQAALDNLLGFRTATGQSLNENLP